MKPSIYKFGKVFVALWIVLSIWIFYMAYNANTEANIVLSNYAYANATLLKLEEDNKRIPGKVGTEFHPNYKLHYIFKVDGHTYHGEFQISKYRYHELKNTESAVKIPGIIYYRNNPSLNGFKSDFKYNRQGYWVYFIALLISSVLGLVPFSFYKLLNME